LINPTIVKMKKYKVTLTKEEREELDALSSKGKQKAQNVLSALILLACDEGQHQHVRSINETIARVLNVSMKTIDRVKKQFVEEGLEAVMTRKPTSRVFAKKVDGDLEARLIALSCSPAPEGHARWTLRLLADKAIELNYVDEISYETVRRTLKKTSSSRGSRKDG
jgi:transposase